MLIRLPWNKVSLNLSFAHAKFYIIIFYDEHSYTKILSCQNNLHILFRVNIIYKANLISENIFTSHLLMSNKNNHAAVKIPGTLPSILAWSGYLCFRKC